jgi:hypothetical protein
MAAMQPTTAPTSTSIHTVLYLLICIFSDLKLYNWSNIFNDPT